MTQVYLRKPHEYVSYFTLSQFAGWQDMAIDASDEMITRYLKNKEEFDKIQDYLEGCFIKVSSEKATLND